jgi:hypothetical protein
MKLEVYRFCVSRATGPVAESLCRAGDAPDLQFGCPKFWFAE